MTVRAWIFAVVLAVAAGLVVAGVAAFSRGGALVVAGGLLAGWAWLILGDVGPPTMTGDDA